MENLNYPNKELIKDLWSFITPYKKKFFIGTFMRITSDLVWLFPPYALSEIITFVAKYETGEEQTYVWQLMIAIVCVSIYHYLLHDWSKNKIFTIAEQIDINARNKALKHLFAIDLEWHEKENSGNKIQKITKGGESLNKLVKIYVSLVIESSINLIAISIIFFKLDWKLSALLMFFFISYYILSYLLTQKAVKQSHKTNLEWEKFYGITFEAINNILIVKSLKIEAKISPMISKISKKLMQEIKKRIFYFRFRSANLNLYQDFFRSIILAFTIWKILEGQFEIGLLTMILFYFNKIQAAAVEFSQTYSEFVTAKIAMIRMKEIMQEKPNVEISGTKKFNQNWEKLEFKNVDFAYHGQLILKKFSLTIKRGEKIGIVGISGTGKSTLFKLILKLYNNYKGKILFDGISLKEITRESYMKKIAIVPQETELFNLSLEENITLTQNRQNKKLLQNALEISHVKDFSHKLPKGLKSLIGEKGIKLSGGEKQRVGIARAIYKNPELLLLDEATSHLDMESEQKIQDTLHKFFRNITAIVIAHRLSTIKEMDKILVMDKGQIIEMGTFDELITLKGKFFELWEKQKF